MPFVDSGEVAPHYHFYNGPGANPFSSARIAIFGTGYTPAVSIDGFPAGSSPSTYAAAINARLAVPSHVAIEVDCVGDETGGTAYISVTAEQDLDTGVKLWSAILQDHQMATGSWGGYNGQEMMWIPIVAVTPTAGTVLDFTGPYPQTIEIEGTYSLNPSTQPYSDLNISVIVQGYESNETKEVYNSYFNTLASASSTAEGTSAGMNDQTRLGAWPNPSSGTFSVSTQLPDGATGTVEIFDVSGRLVRTLTAESVQSVSLEQSGLYLIRLVTASGEMVNRQLAVIR